MKYFLLLVIWIILPFWCIAQYEVSVTEITVFARVVDSSENPIKELTEIRNSQNGSKQRWKVK